MPLDFNLLYPFKILLEIFYILMNHNAYIFEFMRKVQRVTVFPFHDANLEHLYLEEKQAPLI